MPPYQYQPRFIDTLKFEDKGGFPFILTRAFTYVSNVDGLGTIVVPRGFQTDLASIPQFLWNILPPIGKYDWAAVVHDWLYSRAPVIKGQRVNRGQADRVLLEAMQVTPPGAVRASQRAVIYSGVRIGGWKPWGDYRKKEQP